MPNPSLPTFVVCAVGELAAGGTDPVRLNATITAPVGAPLVATAHVGAASPDPLKTNNGDALDLTAG